MNRVPLYEELRLIERSETEINGAWKGAHLLLFFLAFVFGSFCTFCFHMLMYLFDEKCVLFPKLLSLTTVKHNVIYEFIPSTKDVGVLPVDFLSTQWVEKSTCSLPTFVPLVSGIFGLVWTTMFLMCSTGSRTLTGLQRPWRVLPPVFVFSLLMGGLCVYTSVVTHYGLHELCLKLGEITGSPTCSYTVNVATLSHERRIRGVYQATRLTILSAWLHTACWLLSALLALVRVLLAVDFQLVRISAQLHGDIDNILEQNEVQIRTILPDTSVSEENERADAQSQDLLYVSQRESSRSTLSLIPEEMDRLAKAGTYKLVDEEAAFIVTWLYDLVEKIPSSDATSLVSIYSEEGPSSETKSKQQTQETIEAPDENRESAADSGEIEMLYRKADVREPTQDQVQKPKGFRYEYSQPSTSKSPPIEETDVSPETERVSDAADDDKFKTRRKSSLKTVGVQTDKSKRVQIVGETSDQTSTTSDRKDDVEKETQTREKEKQD
ncbi:uncharacterized protein LOC110373479 [Helicoverpa armigera]|uniref:uncharacterized protein LOC110373479 n=1 Tax=Helicoverpa armigera TaxID=29058 RepID=UPI0030830C6D